MIAYNVYLLKGVYSHPITGEKYARKTKLIDTVFCNDTCDIEYVKKSLIEHDGYPSNIVVKRSK